MRNIILICLLLLSSVCFAFNDQTVQFPETSFRSVNTYSSCTSYQPHITPVGATEVYGTNNSGYHPGKPRKVNGNDSNGPTNPNDPYMTPVGDAPIAFILGLGVLYILVMRKKERVED